MKWAGLLCALLVVVCCGCVVKLDGRGEVGFKQCTEWAFYHESQPNAENMNAEAELASQPLLDYLAKDAKDEELDEPVGP